MAGRARKGIQLARDVVVALVSVVIIGSQYQRLGEEPAFLVTVSISALTLLLSVVDAGLVLAGLKWKRYFLGNAAVQLVLGLLWLGLFAPVGAIIVGLNVLALVSLREKKTAEEMKAHPPLPRTRNFKLADGAGTLIMAVSLFLPWFGGSGASVSVVGVYLALATHSGLPGITVSQTGVLFALLALGGSPVAILCGGLGLRWRRLSVVAGLLGALTGIGAILLLGGAVGAGAGAYGLAVGGIVILAAYFRFRRSQ